MPNQGLRVAIVGAGLGGLCLAQGLRRRRVPFEVYERDPSFDSRTQGYRLRIDEVGQRALAESLAEDLFARFRETCAVASGMGRFLDPQLREVPGRPADSWRSADRSADRRLLREILMSGIEDHVHFGKGFRALAPEPSGVRIAHEDGSSSDVFDVLVGADGVGSAVRAWLLPKAAPIDTGAICIYGKAEPSAAHGALREGTSVIFADGFAVVIEAMRFPPHRLSGRLPNPPEDYLYWAFLGPRARFERGPARRAVLRATAGWAPGLRALFEATEEGAIASTAVRSAAPVRAWTTSRETSRVTLLGDAIHVMSPAGGLGANTALADARDLAALLADASSGSLLDAVRAYERAMCRRANAALRASEAGARKLQA